MLYGYDTTEAICGELIEENERLFLLFKAIQLILRLLMKLLVHAFWLF